jgi:hypothetical protein
MCQGRGAPPRWPCLNLMRQRCLQCHPRSAQPCQTHAWRLTMQEEFGALQANDTWTLVPRPPGVNLVTGKWVFCHKYKADDSLDRYKARWSFMISPSVWVLTMMKPSVLWSSQLPFGQSPLWHSLVHGLFINLMWRILFTTAPWMRLSTVHSRLVLSTPPVLTLFST